jgi:hypothetical protein
LIIFSIVSLALAVNYYSTISGLLLFLFAALLKFHPMLGLLYLMKEEKRRFLVLFLSALGIFALYMFLIRADLNYIFTAISQGVGSSYGIHVWWKAIGHPRFFNLPVSESTKMAFQVLSYILAVTITLVTLYLSVRHENNQTYRQGQFIDAFRVGAGIYIGSYVFLTNNDYRLTFLIFTVPQLVAWMRNKEKAISLVPRVTLAAMILSLWSFFVMRFIGGLGAGQRNITTIIEEFANWVMLTSFLYLFFSSLPLWLGDYLRRPFFYIKR